MTDRRSIFLFSLKIYRSLHFNSLPLSTLFLVQLFHRLQFLFSTITLCSSCSPPSQFSRTPVHSTDAPFSCLPRAAIYFSPFVTSSHFHLSFVLWLLYLFPSPCHLLLSLTFLIQNSFPCDAIQNAINMSGKYSSHISFAKGILIFHFQNFYFYFVHYSQGTCLRSIPCFLLDWFQIKFAATFVESLFDDISQLFDLCVFRANDFEPCLFSML